MTLHTETTEKYSDYTITHYKIRTASGVRTACAVGRYEHDPDRTVISFVSSGFLPTISCAHLSNHELNEIVKRATEFTLAKYGQEIMNKYPPPHPKECDHEPDDGCEWCCQICNYDVHYCPSCGAQHPGRNPRPFSGPQEPQVSRREETS
jgi:hypothetical protein